MLKHSPEQWGLVGINLELGKLHMWELKNFINQVFSPQSQNSITSQNVVMLRISSQVIHWSYFAWSFIFFYLVALFLLKFLYVYVILLEYVFTCLWFP